MTQPTPHGIRVLLIEDNPADREIASRALAKLTSPPGPVELVATGQWKDAEEILAKGRFDLLLLDFHLPEQNGLDILRALDGRGVPVIMLTGQDKLGLAIETMRAGAYDYVTKSADPGPALRLAVQRVMQRVELERALATSQEQLAAYAADLQRKVEVRTATVQAQAAAIEGLYLKSEEAARIKADIVANISHELRTPLGVMLGYLELIKDELAPPTEAGALEMLLKVEAQGQRLHGLIESLLSLGELRAGQLGIRDSRFTIAALVRELRLDAELLNGDKRLTVEWTDRSSVASVENDREKIRTVAYHLLSNAIKFTHQGRVEVEVDARSDGTVVLTVSDTGIGLPPEARALVFDDFQQLDGSSTRRFEGLGLGLGIVKRCTALLGGAVRLDSTPGVGTRIVVELPGKAARAAADPSSPSEA